jgi:hypothetical protein
VAIVDMGTGYTTSGQMDSFAVLAGVRVVGKPNSGRFQMEDLKIEHDGRPCGIDEHPCKAQFGSCCCKSRWKTRMVGAECMEIPGALTDRGFRGRTTEECSREMVS